MTGAQTLTGHNGVFALSSMQNLTLVAALILVAGCIIAPTGLFTVDEYFYLRMAEAMANEGALTFRQFDVAGATALDMSFAKPVEEAGRLAPQYPAGYAFVAAPFYLIFGVKGLILLNAFSAFAVLVLTYRIARRADCEEKTAAGAVCVLAIATFWSSYVFAVWPHMLALAIALGAIELALYAGESDNENSKRAAIAAGFVIGLGESVRIDMITLAPAAILWLRLFAPGGTRLIAVLFALAVGAGLILTSAMHWMRDGAFSIVPYDNGVAANEVSDFLPLAFSAITLLAVLVIFDFKRFLPFKKNTLVIMAIVAAIGAAIAAKPVFMAAHGFWYALVDAQAYAHLDRQFGIIIDEWGWLSFYGVSKKALLQSAPFALLAIFPLVRLMRGDAHPVEALLLIIIAGFATLYSVNETDSGLGLNARFLLPLLPALAIFTAVEMNSLIARAKLSSRHLFIAALASAAAFFILRLSNNNAGPFKTPLDLYPQIALALFLAGAIAATLLKQTSSRARFTAIVAAAAIGAGAAISADDFMRGEAYRVYTGDQARLYGAFAPRGALVFTTRPAIYGEAAARGLSIAYPGLNEPDAELAAIKAFNAAGRCIYAQGDGALDWALKTGLFGAPEALPAAYSQGDTAALADNRNTCP